MATECPIMDGEQMSKRNTCIWCDKEADRSYENKVCCKDCEREHRNDEVIQITRGEWNTLISELQSIAGAPDLNGQYK